MEPFDSLTIEKAMRRIYVNISQAAEYLGISRYVLYRKIEKRRL
ncbi:MAG: helix-turn-helix domain-containing protein [Barnesiella sp.]